VNSLESVLKKLLKVVSGSCPKTKDKVRAIKVIIIGRRKRPPIKNDPSNTINISVKTFFTLFITLLIDWVG
jgi:hypothetical protein